MKRKKPKTFKVKKRSCGECTECCTWLTVGVLDKPSGTACQHQCDEGCSIYDERPEDCQKFQCLWSISEPHISSSARPDKSGFVAWHGMTSLGPTLYVSECREGGLGTLEASDLTETYLKHYPVLHLFMSGRRRLFGGPGGDPRRELPTLSADPVRLPVRPS